MCALMYLHDVALVTIAYISEVLGTVSGFGSSTFFVPAALFLESFQFVLALMAILHCFGNFSKITLFRDSMNWGMLWKLAIPAVIFTGLGAVLSDKVPLNFLKRFLGVVLVIVPLLKIFNVYKSKKISIWWGIMLVAISGFFTGLVGTGGALRGLALSALQIPKGTFVLLSASIDIGGDLLRAFIYIKQGYMDWKQWHYLPLLFVVALAGAYTGKVILNRINQKQFEIIVSIFVIISGFMMLALP
jgi:uncharacterized membrane protein YfcA